MKLFFFISVLVNLVYFGWNYRMLPNDKGVTVPKPKEQKVFLLDELSDEQLIQFQKQYTEQVKVTSIGEKTELTSEHAPVQQAENQKREIENKPIVKLKKAAIDVVKETKDIIPVQFPELQVLLEESGQAQNEPLLEPLPEEANNGLEAQLQTEKHCRLIGPFADEESIGQWMLSSGLDQFEYSRETREQVLSTSYLVYFPAAESYQKSKENERMLKNKGIEDLWLFRQGELKGVISLGLFAGKISAEKLQKQFLNQDLDVKIMARPKTQTLIYVKMILNDPNLFQLDKSKSVEVCK